MRKLRFLVLLLTVAICPAAAMAADWPNPPVHFIVPSPAAGSTDVAARIGGDSSLL